MASVLARNTVKKAGGITTILGNQLKGVQCVAPTQVATLRATWGEPFGYKKPYPYKEKKLNPITEFFDISHKRFNENTKIILVDGNIAVGKNEFARKLANAFDLRYYPSVSPERVYLDLKKTYDLRELNEVLPDSCRHYDLADFYSEQDPTCGKISRMQSRWFRKKFENFCTACLHMFSTGQGVVVTSSVHSDHVYSDAMRKMGYITPNWHRWMAEFNRDTVCELLPPHLCIYLSAPIEVIRERIIKRNDPKEVNSKILNDKYLSVLDETYRNNFLEKMRKVCEVIEIDWSEVGDDLDMEIIAEELESLTLEHHLVGDEKFHHWRCLTEDDYAYYRRAYCRQRYFDDLFLTIDDPIDCPEFVHATQDRDRYITRYLDHPHRMAPGTVPDPKKYVTTGLDYE